MHLVQGAIFLFSGAGLLVMVWRSLSVGYLLFGPGIGSRSEVHRDRSPLGYWLVFAIYGVAGIWLTIFALRLLLGLAEPLPLR